MNTISNVDSIYRSTNFDGYSGTGFEIQEIRIHETDTPVNDGQIHYNMETDNWGTKELLQVSHTIDFFVNNPQLNIDISVNHLFDLPQITIFKHVERSPEYTDQ